MLGAAPLKAAAAPVIVWSNTPSMTGPPSSGVGIQSCAEGLARTGPSQAVTTKGNLPSQPSSARRARSDAQTRFKGDRRRAAESKTRFPVELAESRSFTATLSWRRANSETRAAKPEKL